MNAQGVFTMFGWNQDLYDNDSEVTPFGLRYDPAGKMDAKYDYKGPGAWMNMTVDRAHELTRSSTLHSLGYVNNELVHVLLNKAGNGINLAKVDEATKTLTSVGKWSMNSTIYGNIRGMVIGNNHLYTFGDPLSYFDGSPYLTGFPLVTISPTTPIGQIYNTSQVYQARSCSAVYLYYYQNVLTLMCGLYSSSSSSSSFYKITDPDTASSTGPPTNFTSEITYMDYFVPLGDGTGLTSFVLMQQYGKLKVFANDKGFRYTETVDKASITDPVGENPNPNSPSGGSGSGSGSGFLGDDSSSSTGAIIGAILGVLFVVALIAWFVKRTHGTKIIYAPSTAAHNPFPEFPPVNNYAYPQQLGSDGGPVYHDPSGQDPAPSYPLRQNTPTTLLPMAPITPVPPQQLQSMQDQMQALQFSSHPRPNFVTTAHGEESEASNTISANTAGSFLGAAGPSTAPWQPTLFVPPAQLAGSVGTSTLSTGYSPATATAFSSATTHSPQGPQEIVSEYSVASPTFSAFTPLSPNPSILPPYSPMP
ncbi:hypothetical protein BGZ96_001516 [Linnemannia gamsii]|uniref:Peptidase A1 domain-containing protein n=1 Tax=Linnemannia gamsii TaxID=64522 RepID=A0ABQ7JMC9_9FUNG|nr:hypothetical protein BGZ96_001516 [Linnemannia gamsii]